MIRRPTTPSGTANSANVDSASVSATVKTACAACGGRRLPPACRLTPNMDDAPFPPYTMTLISGTTQWGGQRRRRRERVPIKQPPAAASQRPARRLQRGGAVAFINNPQPASACPLAETENTPPGALGRGAGAAPRRRAAGVVSYWCRKRSG